MSKCHLHVFLFSNLAFQTDQERESHIWQVHANDDNKNITHHSVDEDHPPADSTNINDSTLNADEEVIHVELFCAHCAEKFDNQSDLEKHVIEEHRSGSAQQQQNQTCNEYKEKLTDHNISEVLSNTTPCDTFVGNREAEENAITVFEDYDDSEEELSIPTESLQYPIKQEKILDDTQHFAQYRSNFSEDGDDEVTIEHFNQHQETTNDAAIDKMETSSSSEYDSDTDSNTSVSFVQDDVVKLPFACAKCIDKFATVEELLTHNTLMHCQQQQEQNEKSPTKSKFKCDICNKEFDLKFSLNRHMKKHDKTST